MSNEIQLASSGTFEEFAVIVAKAVESSETVEDAANIINGFSPAKKILEAAREYKRHAGEFCALECVAYFKLLDLINEKFGDTDIWWACKYLRLSLHERHALEYLQIVDVSKRDEIVAQCRNDAVSVYTLYRRMKADEKVSFAIIRDRELIASYADEKVKEFYRKSTVTIGIDDVLGRLETKDDENRSLAKGAVEVARDKLLSHGAFGIGGGQYTGLFSSNDARKALEIRVASVLKDLRIIAAICKRWGIYLDERGVVAGNVAPVRWGTSETHEGVIEFALKTCRHDSLDDIYDERFGIKETL